MPQSTATYRSLSRSAMNPIGRAVRYPRVYRSASPRLVSNFLATTRQMAINSTTSVSVTFISPSYSARRQQLEHDVSIRSPISVRAKCGNAQGVRSAEGKVEAAIKRQIRPGSILEASKSRTPKASYFSCVGRLVPQRSSGPAQLFKRGCHPQSRSTRSWAATAYGLQMNSYL